MPARQTVRCGVSSMNRYISRVCLCKQIDEASYLAKIPAVRHLIRHGFLSFERDVTFLVGENASGKSTLLEAIAVAYGFNAEGGTKNFHFSTASTHSALCEYLRIVKSQSAKDGFFLRAESFYNVATSIEEMDRQPAGSPRIIDSYGGVSLHRQSHGESFLALVRNRFRGNGIYLLDEPEAALSPTGVMTLMAQIKSLVDNKAQFIIATHSPILMTFPNAAILEVSAAGIKSVSYKETDHYQITKSFLENPERMLRYLLEDEAPRDV